MAELTAGWRFPINSRKAHYFGNGEIISLCRRWMYAGRSQGESDSHSPDDCTACRKALDKLIARKLADA